jgi:YVTN family beta-propeller protein
VIGTINGFTGSLDPFVIAFNPANKDMYITDLPSNTVSVIDSSTNTVIGTISVGSQPNGIAFNPTNNDMYVANGQGTVSVIDSSTNTVIGTVIIGSNIQPAVIAFNPANKDMYVTNNGLSTVSVISTTTSVQPPTATTITSAVDGNGNPVPNAGSTPSPSITFQVTATPGTNPIAGFQCSLDNSPFSGQ